MNDFGSLRYCQECGLWIETCEHFQHKHTEGGGLLVTFVITDEQTISQPEPEPEEEKKRHWWRFGL